MPKVKSEATKVSQPKFAPAMTPDAREKQLIALATNLAEERLRNGTASSAEIVHFLKMGSTKERLEQEMMQEQKTLLQAKTETLRSAKNIEELYAKAITAMQVYSGNLSEDEY